MNNKLLMENLNKILKLLNSYSQNNKEKIFTKTIKVLQNIEPQSFRWADEDVRTLVDKIWHRVFLKPHSKIRKTKTKKNNDVILLSIKFKEIFIQYSFFLDYISLDNKTIFFKLFDKLNASPLQLFINKLKEQNLLNEVLQRKYKDMDIFEYVESTLERKQANIQSECNAKSGSLHRFKQTLKYAKQIEITLQKVGASMNFSSLEDFAQFADQQGILPLSKYKDYTPRMRRRAMSSDSTYSTAVSVSSGCEVLHSPYALRSKRRTSSLLETEVIGNEPVLCHATFDYNAFQEELNSRNILTPLLFSKQSLADDDLQDEEIRNLPTPEVMSGFDDFRCEDNYDFAKLEEDANEEFKLFVNTP